MTRHWIVGLTCAATLGGASAAHAEPPRLAHDSLAARTSDRLVAEALFDESMQLMQEQRYDQASRLLEESQRLDPAVGTLLYLAHCYEALGRNASAWITFVGAARAARDAGQADRATVATQYADKLKSDLSKLEIDMPSPPDGVEILRDGEPLSTEVVGVPVPVDPGSHSIEVRAPGYRAHVSEVRIIAGAHTQKFTLAALEPIPSKSVALATTVRRHSSAWGGWVLSGVGAVCVAAGAVLTARHESEPAAIVLTGAGGVTLGVGVGILALPPSSAGAEQKGTNTAKREVAGWALGISGHW